VLDVGGRAAGGAGRGCPLNVVDLFAGGSVVCGGCGAAFQPTDTRQKHCSKRCAGKACRSVQPLTRECRGCGVAFTNAVGRGSNNRWHCSTECARQSARAARLRHKERRPDAEAANRARSREKDRREGRRNTLIEKLWRKYPELPHACEACGEARVLDVAHRPEHRRHGAWLSVAVSQPEHIWILCPTCHALLDRKGYTAEQLGLPSTRPVPLFGGGAR
jgi:hypothetical protein